jgi:N-carbamoyl-L-amino-acid hydrolase
MTAFARLWDELAPLGRDPRSGGYRRFAWTRTDLALREWFASTAGDLGAEVVVDRAGNQWAWWGDPDSDGPALVLGSHLDSVPDGGGFDGPLGIASALAAVAAAPPSRPLGIVAFSDEEGARFGLACAGSRLLTGALGPEAVLGHRDDEGVTRAEALLAAGMDPGAVGADPEALGRIGCFVELHVEQGRGLVDTGRPVGVASAIWPHGRWRFTFTGRADHAGTTRLADRDDPMLGYAATVLAARAAAARLGAVATFGKVQVEPNAVNAIPSRVTAWLDARAPDEAVVEALVAELSAGLDVLRESWTGDTRFDAGLSSRLSRLLDQAPVLATGAGHDAGVLAQHGIPAAMLFVRNPTGVSHSPAEHADQADCEAGVEALGTLLRELP